jgi:DNA-directed RNA polymerase subunit K/omega
MTTKKSPIKMDMNANNNINKPATASSTITRDLRELDVKTGNIYESLVIMSKRANQISNNIKEELHQKLSEFASSNDNLEEVFENREQIEISKYYERLPKPTLVAIQEFLDDKVYYRNPAKEV